MKDLDAQQSPRPPMSLTAQLKATMEVQEPGPCGQAGRKTWWCHPFMLGDLKRHFYQLSLETCSSTANGSDMTPELGGCAGSSQVSRAHSKWHVATQGPPLSPRGQPLQAGWGNRQAQHGGQLAAWAQSCLCVLHVPSHSLAGATSSPCRCEDQPPACTVAPLLNSSSRSAGRKPSPVTGSNTKSHWANQGTGSGRWGVGVALGTPTQRQAATSTNLPKNKQKMPYHSDQLEERWRNQKE